MGNPYDTDFVAWAYAQAALLRNGDPRGIDNLKLAEEIEGLARSERRELGRRLAALFAHLLKWKVRPDDMGNCSRLVIQAQRDAIAEMLDDSPSLCAIFDQRERMERIWRAAVASATYDTGMRFSAATPWGIDQALDPNFFPED